MQKKKIILRWFVIFCLIQVHSVAAQDLKPASSMNPVGSGARAIGMGGAFIGVADDATAASWNPGGLLQLDTPEISVVGNWFHRTEDNRFGSNPEADGSYSVSKTNLNYFSLVYPFTINCCQKGKGWCCQNMRCCQNKGHQDQEGWCCHDPEKAKEGSRNINMVFALNYQHLYDFKREFNFSITEDGVSRGMDFQQRGGLSAIGLAWGIKLHPQFYFGVTLNIWEDNLFCDDNFNSRWEANYHEKITVPGLRIDSRTKEEYQFSGVNTNIGILWHTKDDRIKIGAVFKSPFKGDLKYTLTEDESQEYLDEKGNPVQSPPDHHTYSWYGKLEMPMSYGAGFAWRIRDELTVSADIYRTEWGNYTIRDPEEEISPVTGLPVSESDIGPTHQVRAGLEYVWLGSDYLIPIRCGVFYDPEPAKGSPDDFYGASIGSGITANRFSFDVAFEWRFGRDVGSSMVPENYHFSQDVNEYNVYSSFILYFD